MPLGCSPGCSGHPAFQVGQQGYEEPALEDAEVAAHGPGVEVKLLSDPGTVNLSSGRTQDGVEDRPCGADVQGLGGEHLVPEYGERVRLHLVLPGGPRARQTGERESGQASGFQEPVQPGALDGGDLDGYQG